MFVCVCVCVFVCVYICVGMCLKCGDECVNDGHIAVLLRHTLSKVLYLILAKFKNFSLFILFFSQIFKKFFL